MAMLPILAAVAGAGPPPNNASLCAVESCMVMPTGCGQRPECAGCGELCFGSGGRGGDAAGWDLFLNATGLSDQDNAASVFRGPRASSPCRAALSAACSTDRVRKPFLHESCDVCAGKQQHALRAAGCTHADIVRYCAESGAGLGSAAAAPSSCQWPTAPHCIRGAGNDTLRRYKATEPPSASTSACCAACASATGCAAWQLITRAGTEAAECWLMAVTDVKSDSPDSCVSGAPPPPPSPTAGLVRSADAVLIWADVQPLPPPAPYDWSALIGACQRAHTAGGKLTILLWTGTQAPLWIYNHSDIEMIAESYDKTSAVPNYRNPNYQELLRDVHLSMAATLRSLGDVGRTVIAIQPCVGSTGDDTPIHITDGTGHRHGGQDFRFVNYTLLDRIGGPGSNSTSTWWPHFFQNFSMWLANDCFAAETKANEMTLLLNAQVRWRCFLDLIALVVSLT